MHADTCACTRAPACTDASHTPRCLCLHTCTHINTCARTRIHTHTSALVRAHVCTQLTLVYVHVAHTRQRLHTCAHTGTCACTHIRMHTPTSMVVLAHTCTRQHLHVCTCTHPHVCTFTCTCTLMRAHVHTHQHLCVCIHVLTLACARTCTCWHLYTHVCTDFLSSSTHYCRLPWSTACLGNSKVCFALLGITEHPHLLRTGSPFRLSLPATLAEHATCVHGVRAGSDL